MGLWQSATNELFLVLVGRKALSMDEAIAQMPEIERKCDVPCLSRSCE